ncbi:MAG: ribose 5-phosphate isomerase B [Lachnospiraceae bacterium]|nr:ribose 5-phosphate isomerase B [Lachnospiraceae bacterium]MBO4559537.1 ribose 5-phosphate isomerase B [Lachnospiraceae bacterium]MBR5733632.1 ribose 5-phosphate isomerase B [Lachnospiraceae bacterium]
MIAIGSDHAGYGLKQIVIQHLDDLGIAFNDYGTYSSMSCDYPDFAEAVCQAIMKGQADKGILICGTGIGMSMAANRHREIRAALCDNCYSAKATREHNDANVLCMGARVLGEGLAIQIVDTFLETEFSNGANHVRRISKLS